MLIRYHEATDRNEDKKYPREIISAYESLVWRKQRFPTYPYPDVDFDLEYWKENWRDIWYFHIPDIMFHDGLSGTQTSEKRKKAKKALKEQPYRVDGRHKNPGRPPMLLIADGIEYPSCRHAAAHYKLQEQSVRNRCQSTIEKWVDWYWIR